MSPHYPTRTMNDWQARVFLLRRMSREDRRRKKVQGGYDLVNEVLIYGGNMDFINQAIRENIPPSSENNSEIKRVRQFTRKEVSQHSEFSSCWIFIGNDVYDVTQYLDEHPGGAEIILEFAGSDATSAFLDKGHSKTAVAALKTYFIGQIAREDRLYPDVDEVLE